MLAVMRTLIVDCRIQMQNVHEQRDRCEGKLRVYISMAMRPASAPLATPVSKGCSSRFLLVTRGRFRLP